MNLPTMICILLLSAGVITIIGSFSNLRLARSIARAYSRLDRRVSDLERIHATARARDTDTSYPFQGNPRRTAPADHPAPKEPAEDPIQEGPADPGVAALPVDENNPPRIVAYNPKPGVEFTCHCHNRKLVPGQRVILWPNPNQEGAYWRICPTEEQK